MMFQNAALKPPSRSAVSYRELFPEDSGLDVVLDGLYLNVSAVVIVDYIACIDSKLYLICRVLPHLSSAALVSVATAHSLVRISAASFFFFLYSGGLDFLP